MAARYVIVASMDEGQIQTTAHDAEQLLDLRDRFLADPTCQELALYRLVCVEQATSADEEADRSGVSYLRPRPFGTLDAAG